jgi:hypothetical protein
VPYTKATLPLDSVFSELTEALEGRRKYTGVNADLEGFVLRSWSDGTAGADKVAKIRADDIPKIMF